jgi:hypothetical protein
MTLVMATLVAALLPGALPAVARGADPDPSVLASGVNFPDASPPCPQPALLAA